MPLRSISILFVPRYVLRCIRVPFTANTCDIAASSGSNTV